MIERSQIDDDADIRKGGLPFVSYGAAKSIPSLSWPAVLAVHLSSAINLQDVRFVDEGILVIRR